MKSPVLRFFLDSQAFMALCALAALWQTCLWASLNLAVFWTYAPVLWAGTVLIYAYHRRHSGHLLAQRLGQTPNRLAFAFSLQPSLLIFWFLSALWGLWGLLHLPWTAYLALIPGGLGAAFYVLPFLPKGRRGRDLPWLKGPMLCLGWVYATLALPCLWAEVWPQNFWLALAERLLWIWLLLLPLDLRDALSDRSLGAWTLPAHLGEQRSRFLGWFLAGFWALLVLWIYPWPLSLALAATALPYAWILKRSRLGQDSWAVSLGSDGLLILQALLWTFFMH